MRQFGWFRGKTALGFLLVLTTGLAVAGWHRTALLAQYDGYRLARADDATRAARAREMAELDEAGLAVLVGLFRSADPAGCLNARAAIDLLAERWRDDPRRPRLFQALADAYPVSSPAGQAHLLEVAAVAASAGGLSTDAVAATTRLLSPAGRSSDKEMRVRMVALARALAVQGGPETASVCRERIREALTDGSPEVRVAAAFAASTPDLNLLAEVAPLLDDAAPEVRQAALVTLGPPEAAPAVSTDDLLRSLHDPDADVRRLCETALRSRSLSDRDILMGRLVTSPRATARLQVLEKLRQALDLEPGVWLRRLSRDPSPAVRAAAVRASTDYPDVDMAERLAQMARSDPSETVRQLAEHYLSSQQKSPLSTVPR